MIETYNLTIKFKIYESCKTILNDVTLL